MITKPRHGAPVLKIKYYVVLHETHTIITLLYLPLPASVLTTGHARLLPHAHLIQCWPLFTWFMRNIVVNSTNVSPC